MKIAQLFGADKIEVHDLLSLQGLAPDIIVWAAPVMFFFVLIEYFITYLQSKEYYNKKETIGSTLVGVGNVTIGVLIKTFLFYLFIITYNLIPWRMELNWWTFIPCYIIFDLCSYWAHNISHRLRLLWALMFHIILPSIIISQFRLGLVGFSTLRSSSSFPLF